MKIISCKHTRLFDENKLSTVVAQIISQQQSSAVQQNSFFVNDIPANLKLYANKDAFVSIMEKVMLITTSYSENACIRVTAKAYHDILLLHFKISDTLNNLHVASQLNNLKVPVQELAGFLEISSIRNRVVTIAFTLHNIKNSKLSIPEWDIQPSAA